jgi:uncharacterized LabA/DUF88 family protein
MPINMPRYNNYAFIDGANLHLTYQTPDLDWKLDYQKLLNYLRKKLEVSIAYYFIGNTKESADIFQNLESYGYTVRLKEPTLYWTEEEYCPYCDKVIAPELPRHKSDCDSYMTLQVMYDLDNFNKAILITSDGDFDNLAKWLLQRNKLKMIFAPCEKGCSWLLKKVAMGNIAFIDNFRNELEKT